MRSVEISAASPEEARRAAAFQLGVRPDQIEIEVLEQPRKLFGLLGSGQYTVRATYNEAGPAPSAEMTPTVSEGAAEATEPAEPEAAIVREAAYAAPPAFAPPTAPAEQPADPKQAIAERAQQVTEDIAALMGVNVRVTIAEVTPEEVKLILEGDEGLALLIGQYGATLDALQLVVAIAANKGIEDGCRVVLDSAGGYRARHEEHLVQRAHEAAAEAKETGREVVIADLRSYERRLMHMALVDDPEVTTYSEGHDADRCLVISPRQPD